LIVVDELATNEPGSLSKGMGWTVPILAEAIHEMCERWKVRAEGCADDAVFARSGSGAGSIAEEFGRANVCFYPARKADRRSGWETMRRLLQDAGKPDVPALYFARRCEYTWATRSMDCSIRRRPRAAASLKPLNLLASPAGFEPALPP